MKTTEPQTGRGPLDEPFDSSWERDGVKLWRLSVGWSSSDLRRGVVKHTSHSDAHEQKYEDPVKTQSGS